MTYLAYVVLEWKCGQIVLWTRNCSGGKSINSSLPQCLVTQLTSNFILNGAYGSMHMFKLDHKKGFMHI